ncbi:MAG: S8 family serine peptidase [Candidatus Magnetoovum sp. WYHC-5]|nr:S8 family serine peptidase [Candidatus Magnetoovum sp. WYHC-5]
MRKYCVFLLLIILITAMLTACGQEGSKLSEITEVTASQKRSEAKNVYRAHDPSTIPDSGYVEDELIVKFKDEVDEETVKAVHDGIGTTFIKKITAVDNLELVKLPQGMTVKDAVELYNQDANVQYAEPNYIMKGSSISPNDPYFSQQYSLYNDGSYKNGTVGADIKVTEAWEISTGSPNIVVAIIDTGVNYNHPDLGSNVWSNSKESRDGLDNDGNGFIDDVIGWDFIGDDYLNPTEDNDPMDDYGHGTHVSGTIGALTNNKEGVSGINWEVKIMPLRALGADLETTVSAVVAAIGYATDNGANVINASWGWSDHRSNALYEAIEAALKKNILFVAAAGNESQNIDYVADYPSTYDIDNIMVVSASDQNDELASFTNFGAKVVDVAAPGVDICSTVTPYNGSILYDCSYSGTSMSAPHVSGLAALLWSYYTQFDYAQIKSMIKEYVDVFDEDYSGKLSSKGRINAWKSMSALWAAANLVATSDVAGAVTINWTDRATAETGYKVYRKEGEGDFWEVSELSENAESFVDINTGAGVEYSYMIKAYNSIGFSPDSNSVSVTTVAPDTSSGGGGGCSITGVNEHKATRFDMLLTLLPFIVYFMLKLRIKKEMKTKIKE